MLERGVAMKFTTLAERPQYSKVVAQIIYEEFVLGTSSKMTLADVEHFFQHTHIDAFPITFIAIAHHECVGTVSIFENDFSERPHYSPWLASLYVKPAYRSKKIGQQLMAHVQQHVKALNYKEVYLKTEHAAAYYKERNWQLIETVHSSETERVMIFKYVL